MAGDTLIVGKLDISFHFLNHCIYAQFSLLSIISRLWPHASSWRLGAMESLIKTSRVLVPNKILIAILIATILTCFLVGF